MRKVAFLLIMLISLVGTSLVRAEDNPGGKNPSDIERYQSIVIYHYKDASGKEVSNEFATYKDLPDELKNKNWDCWVDERGWYNCQTR